jgi:hypothetical protein
MSEENLNFPLAVEGTKERCPVGEELGPQNLKEGKTPVLSCDGACVRGEIARVAVNMVAKEDAYARGCHGELLAVPDSGISNWIHDSDKAVLIDGCFLRCHGRIIENIIDKNKLIQFDALSHYKKYQTLFDIDSVPTGERTEVARNVADWVLSSLDGGG